MAKSKYILSAFSAAATLLAMTGCTESGLQDETPEAYEGPVSVTLDIRFNPFAERLMLRSADGVDANLDFDIHDLVVIFYDSELETAAPAQCRVCTAEDFTVNEQEERDEEVEPHTRHIGLKVENIEAGKAYRVYAAANVADVLTDTDWTTVTESALRELVIPWGAYSEQTQYASTKDPRRWSVPDAMFGYFHEAVSDHDTELATDASRAAQDVIYHIPSYWNYDAASGDRKIETNRAAPITFDNKDITIHVWLKRVVSRLTVGFDGTELNSGVEIYVKSVRVRDAVAGCLIGCDNCAGEGAGKVDLLAFDASDARLNIVYSETEGASGDALTKTSPAFPRQSAGDKPRTAAGTWNDSWYSYVHGDSETLDPAASDVTAPRALYFMENIQGKVSPYDGPKDYPKAGASGSDSGKDLKDGKPFGTYVEVDAYYRNTKKRTEGPIVYRFMLGQNITDDFNTERNHHYKLTMQFKGDANDIDWHIAYTEKEE